MTSPDDTRRFFDRVQQFEDAAFWPSKTIERLILQVLGGWSNLVEQVRWQRYHAAGVENQGEIVHPNAEQLGKTLKNIARDAGIRAPGAEMKSAAATVRDVRNDLAHMLYLEEIEGESPHRTVNYVRVDGMEFADEKWSAQKRRRVAVTEDRLREALAATKWLMDCVSALDYVGQILDEFPDDAPLPGGVEHLPWWFDDWGDKRTAQLTVGDMRAAR
ncbi:hypothetical protein CH289_11930 [Rhodococcus sp. RS1C4]|uniref:hypothetical protein n=1 Tax=Rhodococcus sp. 114MFTsu3.1 TaxID=1172184 RepID=UPI0003630F5D|nr:MULTISPECIES: hypothetical protein [unclassified Rhodococcus (in: high G+C Gram-positive bacteria)]OZC52981.1 hypothetical protein CH289_11930 [Rhodococcus sp. RS1C4]